MTQILIADDHPLFRQALAMSVRAVIDADVSEAASLEAVHRNLGEHPDTDLLLLDLHMPGSHGLAGLASVRSRHPQVAVAMVSGNDDPTVMRKALAAGAQAFIPKSAPPEQLGEALRAVFACQVWLPPGVRMIGSDPEIDKLGRLTPQQFRVLELVAGGKLNKQIADALGIQERTVKAHLQAIFEKLGVRNRTQAGVALRELALADPSRGDFG